MINEKHQKKPNHDTTKEVDYKDINKANGEVHNISCGPRRRRGASVHNMLQKWEDKTDKLSLQDTSEHRRRPDSADCGCGEKTKAAMNAQVQAVVTLGLSQVPQAL